MKKTALVLDLDNTIYPVSSIGEELFKSLFELINNSGEFDGKFQDIKKDIMKIPFQKVAKQYHFSEQLKNEGIALLKELVYEKEMHPFKDYKFLRILRVRKFLVTTGFTRMQRSKINRLQIGSDFDEIHIIDNTLSELSKKDIFVDILKRNNLNKEEVLVVGDDINSEIQAAKEIGVDTVLYSKESTPDNHKIENKISDFSHLTRYM